MVKEKIENETKEEKFKRIAILRANRILDDLRLLSNCSNRSIYHYTNEEVYKIFNVLEKEMKRAKIMFEEKKRKKIEL